MGNSRQVGNVKFCLSLTKLAHALLEFGGLALDSLPKRFLLRFAHGLEPDTLISWKGRSVIVIAVPDRIGYPIGKGIGRFADIKMAMPAPKAGHTRQGRRRSTKSIVMIPPPSCRNRRTCRDRPGVESGRSIRLSGARSPGARRMRRGRFRRDRRWYAESLDGAGSRLPWRPRRRNR